MCDSHHNRQQPKQQNLPCGLPVKHKTHSNHNPHSRAIQKPNDTEPRNEDRIPAKDAHDGDDYDDDYDVLK